MVNDQQPSGSSSQASQSEVQAVGLKPPPFWKSNAVAYFHFIEAQFATSGIYADQTKYYCLVSSLDESILSHVTDLICSPPTHEKYDTLKKRLIDQFSESETSKLRLLLHDLELGDRKPSQLLREMKELAKDFSEEAVKSLWLQRLPVSVQQILSVSNEPLDQQALMADKIQEVSKSAVVSAVDKRDPEPTEVSTLRQEISALREQVSRLSRPPQRRSGSRNGFRSKSRSAERKASGLCWYHYRFGKRAHKCQQPCKFVSENL